MELEKFDQEMRFEEGGMEQNIGFVKALQELKNLRPQLYSAAEYCEKSYRHSERKQMVLDNLKDFAVRALVNAVDHLGTVAYKLTDLIDQQTFEISASELHVTRLNQHLLTCQTYTDNEALRQQQLLAILPRHHKHYTLPNFVSKKVHFSPRIQTDPMQSRLQPPPRQVTSGTPAATSLLWHLASEAKSTLKSNSRPLMSIEDPKTYGRTPGPLHASDGEEGMRTKSSSLASSAAMQTLGITQRDSVEATNPTVPFRSFDSPKHELVRAHVRSKSVLSAFFVKEKTLKLRTGVVS